MKVVADQGLSTTTVPARPSTSKLCLQCAQPAKHIKRCKLCGSGCYCSSSCKDAHSPEHKLLCESIRDLEATEFRKSGFSVREVNQVNVKNSLVRLIGEKPLLHCTIDNVPVDGLWDTGSPLCMVDSQWFSEKFPGEEIMSIMKFLRFSSVNDV